MANTSAPRSARFSGVFKNDVDGTVDLYENGTKIVRLNSTGVTIGSADPYTIPVVDGAANEILKTDGSGAVAWAADATGA